MVLAKPKIKFAGYIVGRYGIELDPDKIEAVNKFPTRAKRQDLKSFMGLINQFEQFNKAVTKSSYMLKPLLSTKSQFVWLTEHQKVFEELKEELSKSPSLSHFHPKYETRLETDASRLIGFDYAPLQKTRFRVEATGSWVNVSQRC